MSSKPAVGTRKATQPFGLAMLDQALSSGTNFLVAFAALRLLPSVGYASFSTAVAVALGAVAVIRSFAIESSIGGRSASTQVDWAPIIAVIQRLTMPLAVVCLIALALGNEVALAPLAGLVSVPMLSAFEVARYRRFVAGRMSAACLLDAVWLVSVVTGVLLISPVHPNWIWFFVIWVLPPGIVAGLAGGFGWPVTARTVRAQLATPRARSLAIDTIFESGTLWALIALNWVVGGADLVAAFNACRILFGPLTVAVLAISPFYASLRSSASGSTSRWWSIPVATVIAIGGIVAFAVWFGDGWMPNIAGPTWQVLRPLMVPFSVYCISYALLQVGRQQVRYFGAERNIARLRVNAAACLILIPYFAQMLGLLDSGYWLALLLAIGSSLAGAPYLYVGYRSIENFAPS